MDNKVYILHGWTYSLTAWDACISQLRKHGLDPIVLKVPGLTEHSEDVWTLESYVEWLVQILSDKKDITLICHSNGGRIALAYASRNPSKIAKLILIDSAGIRHNELSLKARRAVFGSLAKAGRALTSSPKARKVFYRLIGAKDYERAPENMRKTMRNLLSVDLTPELENVEVPTLLIWGERDTATPVSDARIMHERIKNSKLITIPNTGHSPHMTHPEKVAEDIVEWLTA